MPEWGQEPRGIIGKPEVIRSPNPGDGSVWKFPIIHEDDDLLVLNKPPNLAVTESFGWPEARCLLPRLHRNIHDGAAWARSRNLVYLMPVNRVDPEISGVLIFAKDKIAHTAVADQLGAQKPLRQYRALVRGSLPAAAVRVDQKLAVDPAHPDRVMVDPEHGKMAISEIALLEVFRLVSMVVVTAWTERPQQLRVHLSTAGHVAVGDRVYGGRPLMLSSIKPGFRPRRDRPESPLMGRPAIHARAVKIRHPKSGVELLLEAPLAKDFSVSLKYLREFSASD